MKDGQLQNGFIVCVGIGFIKLFPSLQALPDLCDMVAFCDIVEERAVKAAKEYGAPGAKTYTDYNEMLKDDSIDVVHVLTPNVVHAPATVAAFEAGKHVLCEKPMAVPTWGVFPNKALQGGGPLIDIGTHALDMTLWMMDNYKPVSVSGSVFYKLGHLEEAAESNIFGPWDPKTYEVEDSAFGFIKMENGATIYLESSWALNMLGAKEAATTLCGTKAGCEIRSGMIVKDKEVKLVYNRGLH